MAPIHRNHGNKRRAERRHQCRVRLAQHIYEKLGVYIDATRVRLKPGPDDPYRWLVMPSKKHLLEKQLSKSSVRDYDEICSAVDDSALEAVPADEYMQRRAIPATDSTGSTQRVGNQLNRPVESFATKTIHLTAENDMLQIAHQESVARADRAEAALTDMRIELQDAQNLIQQLQAEAYDLNGKLQKSLCMMETYKKRAQDSDKAIQTLVEAVDTARSQASSTCSYF
ncbi:hypothetical protein AJ79_09702 [Helicocarpus griseus UAMH5409]|uniref:Uncharacterized protein n=1 Tax=Helicocarpus griseus UAMH5409 TaxID=1447875 RepID=A0A2B7WI15_9EURO|nr:hypothetical protein AJ79_09702 [Helicocarpus griseus UAMH5409]